MTTELQMQDTASITHFDSSQPPARSWSEMAALVEYPRIEQRPRRGLSRRALNRACSFIAENLGERFTLDDLAREAGVSRFHFARLFRVSTGDSPIELPTAPNTSGTATAIEFISDIRTPAASPIRPGGARLCSSDITIG